MKILYFVYYISSPLSENFEKYRNNYCASQLEVQYTQAFNSGLEGSNLKSQYGFGESEKPFFVKGLPVNRGWSLFQQSDEHQICEAFPSTVTQS